jgi:hypothetical protein
MREIRIARVKLPTEPIESALTCSIAAAPEDKQVQTAYYTALPSRRQPLTLRRPGGENHLQRL